MPVAAVYEQDFEPRVLKQLMVDCDISQGSLAEAAADELGRRISRPSINLAANRDYEPPSIPGFRAAIENALRANPVATHWLATRGLGVADLWQPLGAGLRNAMPTGAARRTVRTRSRNRNNNRPALIPGDPEAITIAWEVEMISPKALKHFRLFRSPFIDDVQSERDIYMSEEHRYIEAAMLDAARHGGFLAVIGEVGSGKSVMRRKIIERLNRDGDVLVIYPQMIDKTRLTAASICDAIVQDISSEKCRVKLEDKSRQVERLLKDRSANGYRACLIIEEAHDLHNNTLKYLKRFYELEYGYRKLLGIILIGQTELKHRMNEGQNVDMREVIRRVQIAEIMGLNGHLRDYLAVKFSRLKRDVDDIFDEEAIHALGRRLTSKSRDGKQQISHAYPLLVNNYAARALNLAVELGEDRVTAEVIEAI